MKRPALKALAAIGVVGAAALGFGATALGGSDAAIVPAGQNDSTYEITGFTKSEAPEAGGSLFKVSMRWSTDAYPGDVDCEFHGFDSSGGLVDSQLISIASLVPQSTFDVPFKSTEVSRVSGDCEAAQALSPDAGYKLSNVAIEGEHLIADVKWTTDTYPGTGACTGAVTMKDGRTETLKFTIEIPEGRYDIALLPGTLQDAISATASCEQYGTPES